MARKEMISTSEYTYTVVLEPDEEDGGFTVTCPALPGLVTHGDTIAEARVHAAEAIQGYLESLRKDGAPFPVSEKRSSEARGEAVHTKL